MKDENYQKLEDEMVKGLAALGYNNNKDKIRKQIAELAILGKIDAATYGEMGKLYIEFEEMNIQTKDDLHKYLKESISKFT